MIFKYISIVRRSNMFITLGTASEYVSQNLSNMLSLKEWFSHNCWKTRENHNQIQINFLMFGPLMFAFNTIRNGSEIFFVSVHGKLNTQNKSTQVHFQFCNFRSYNIKKLIQLRLPRNCSQSCNSNTAENKWIEIIETKYANFCMLFTRTNKFLHINWSK